MKKKVTILSFLLVLGMIIMPFQHAYSASLGEKLAGKLLLQVEARGEVWLVAPEDQKRYLVTLENALELFKKFSLGITNADLAKIPDNPNSLSDIRDSDNDGVSDRQEVLNRSNPLGAGSLVVDTSLGNRLQGKLLLQVEDKGKIWYVDFTGQKWRITQENLLPVFRSLALGITNRDLETIPMGSFGDTSPVVTPSNSTSTSTPQNVTPTPQPVVTQSNKPDFARLLEDLPTMSGQEVAQILYRLPQEEMFFLEIYNQYGTLVHLKACEYDASIIMNSSYGPISCAGQIANVQQALAFITVEAFLQNAETQRLQIVNSLACSNGQANQSTCQLYSDITNNTNTIIYNVGQEILYNMGGYCKVGIDPGCY